MYLELEKREKAANLNYHDMTLPHRSYNDVVIIGRNSQALTKRPDCPY